MQCRSVRICFSFSTSSSAIIHKYMIDIQNVHCCNSNDNEINIDTNNITRLSKENGSLFS